TRMSAPHPRPPHQIHLLRAKVPTANSGPLWRYCMRLRDICPSLMILLLTVPSPAQETRGAIVGAVSDPTGAAIAGAQAKAVTVTTNAGANSVANERGVYEIPYLLPGVYRVIVESKGFKKSSREGVELRSADRLLLDFKLQVGDVTESLNVVAESPLLEA